MLTKHTGKHSQSLGKLILARIQDRGEGYVFTPADFLDLGERQAIHQVLSRGARTGAIRKLARGLYDLPERDPQLGLLSPRAEAIAQALGGRDAIRLQAAGAYAASALGLTTQVPQKVVYLTDGSSRKVQIGARQILLKKTTPRQMATAGKISGTAIQALRWIGRANVTDATIAHLRRKLTASEKMQLLADIRYAPTWVAQIMRRIADSSEP